MLDGLAFSLKNVLLPAVSTIIIGFLCNLARHYIQRIKDEQLREFLRRLVNAAEQIYGPGSGAAKYEYVVRQAQRRGYQVTRTDVEAAVYDINSKKEVDNQ